MTTPLEPSFFVELFGYKIPVFRIEGYEAMTDCAGLWDLSTRRIFLDSDLDEDRLSETMLHECMHAVSDLANLNVDEQDVRILALGLHQMLSSKIPIVGEAGEDPVPNDN